MRPRYDEVRDFQRDAHGAHPGTIRRAILDVVAALAIAAILVAVLAAPHIVAECDETTYTCTDH